MLRRQAPRSHRQVLSSVLAIAVACSSYVSANTERLVALETFEHLQSLSLGFHLQRETGSVLRSVSRGASSFAGLLRIVLFQILPVFVQVGCITKRRSWLPPAQSQPALIVTRVAAAASFLCAVPR